MEPCKGSTIIAVGETYGNVLMDKQRTLKGFNNLL
jgi:hypothetical protein